MMRGLVIAAPASGSGKTTLTLGLLAALRARGVAVRPFKCGPDYIDPAFHKAASRRDSVNLDSWAMPKAQIIAQINAPGAPAELALAEASMGLFDGVAAPGETGIGASADIAALTGWPVLLVIDVSGQAQSAAAVARGFALMRPDVRVAGVVLNKIASPRHEALLRKGMQDAGIAVLGALPRRPEITLPERHLGLVQAAEHPRLTEFLTQAGDLVDAHCDLDAIIALAAGGPADDDAPVNRIAAPGERIALAQDEAFSFIYPHLIAAWRAQGATILPFSPLADQAPADDATVCWLPGGYPELHAGRLAAATRFCDGIRDFAQTRPVHGECGGYMTLGAGLEDKQGQRHQMLGLLGLETSFAKRKMQLGYRLAWLKAAVPGYDAGRALRGHEFHYASILNQPDAPLAEVRDANGDLVPETGSTRRMDRGGAVTGSFFHLISPASAPENP